MSKEKRKEIASGSGGGSRKSEKESALGYFSSIALVLLINIFLYQPFKIPSASMMPTLLIGDFIFVCKFSYGYSRYSVFFQPQFITKRITFAQPKRGDVAVFFHKFYKDELASFYDRGIFGGFLPRVWRNIRAFLRMPQQGVNYVKRVIGLPGDRIQMKDGKLFINGEETKLDYEGEYAIEDEEGLYIAKQYIETLPNGKKHPILKIFKFGQAHLDNTEEFVVPAKSYFMMGDNRDNSCDSRAIDKVGIIHEKFLVGTPELIFFSTKAQWYEVHKWIFDVRYDRLLRLVK
jgi:signal peptidase I